MTSAAQSSRPLSPSQSELMDKMLSEAAKKEYRAVSFKLMGTLVLMPFSDMEDMFLFMEDEFAMLNISKKTFTQYRMEAAEAAAKKCELKGCVTLEMIYDIFMKLTGIHEEYRSKLMKRECELVEYFAFPRECGKRIFREAKSKNKKVIITADTIYPRSVVVNILESCGYGSYDGLVIPAEQNLPDSANTAYLDAVTRKAGVKPQKILHVGGDILADVEAPILRGMKALLMQPVMPLMIRSGRVRGFVQNQKLYDIDSPKFLALKCIFALYAAYGFDVPQNKQPRSDFCLDGYMLGFLVAGTLGLSGEYKPETELEGEVLTALEQFPEASKGKQDFENMFYAHFGDHLGKFGYEGCRMPFQFLMKYSYEGDRELLRKYLSTVAEAEWAAAIDEPKLAPVYGDKRKKNAVARLADRMFPPGTKVRNIAEGILSKGRKI